MLSLLRAIGDLGRDNHSAPAIVTGKRVLTFGELAQLIASAAARLAESARPGAKAFLNFADPDLRLVATLACFQARLVPFVLADLGELRGEIDYDLVIAGPVPHVADLAADVTLGPGLAAGAEPGEPPTAGEDALLLVAAGDPIGGQRRLIGLTHGALARQRLAARLAERLAPGERVLFTYGDASLYGMLLSAMLLAAGAAIVRPLGDAAATLRAMALYGVTRLMTTPPQLEQLCRHLRERGERGPALRGIDLAGGPISPDAAAEAARLFAAGMTIAYGNAELGAVSEGPLPPGGFEPGYVGELLPGVRIVTTASRERPAPLTLVPADGIPPTYHRGRLLRTDTPFATLPDHGYLVGKSLFLAVAKG